MPPKSATKNVRTRDASGRFVSKKLERQIASAENGTVYSYNVAGVIRYRDERGAFVDAQIAQATRGGVKRRLHARAGEVRPMRPAPKAERTTAPKGWQRVLKLDVRGQSLSKMVEGNVVNDADTFVRWRGQIVKVPASKGAALSDALRVMVSDYMQDFKGYVEYPELTIDVYETTAGDLIDLDRVTLMPEGMEEDMLSDEGGERAAERFRAHMELTFDGMLPKPQASTNAKAKAVQNPVRSKRRSSARPTHRKRRK